MSWQQESCNGGGADRRIGHTITYDPDKKVVYVYGGSKTKRWFSDVNILDLQTNTWSAVKVCSCNDINTSTINNLLNNHEKVIRWLPAELRYQPPLQSMVNHFSKFR